MHVVASGILSHWPKTQEQIILLSGATMSKFLNYQILVDIMICTKLEKVKEFKVLFFILIFYYWS